MISGFIRVTRPTTRVRPGVLSIINLYMIRILNKAKMEEINFKAAMEAIFNMNRKKSITKKFVIPELCSERRDP